MKNVRFLLTAVAAVGFFLITAATGFALEGALRVQQAAHLIGMPVLPIALSAVNAMGTLQSAQLIMQRAFALTFTKFPALKTFSMAFKELDGKVTSMRLGQEAVSKIRVLPSLGNFGDAASAMTMTDVTAKLRNFPQISHTFTVDELNMSEINFVNAAAMPMAVKLAQVIPQRMAALVATSNFNTTVNSISPVLTVASGWTRANTILPMQTACNERGIPDSEPLMVGNDSFSAPQSMQRFFLHNSTVGAALLADSMIVAELNNPNNAGAIKSGRLPEVSGFGFTTYPQMPNTDGNLVGCAGTPDALAYVARAPITPWDLIPDLPRNALFTTVVDPVSGFAAILIVEGAIGDLGITMRLIWLDGLSVGNPTNLVRLVTGAAAGSSGTVVGLTMTNVGYGYRNGAGAFTAPVVSFTGGGGTGAAATATISANGAVTGLTITNAGTGYTTPPTVVFTPASSGSVTGPATAVATVAGLS